MKTLINEMDVLVQLKRGDERAFKQIYAHYYDFLLSYAYKLSQEEQEAEDIVQDIFLNLWKKKDDLDINSSLFSYLHQSVRFGFFKRERSKDTRTSYKEDLRLFINQYTPSGDEYLFEKELIDRLEKLAEQLPGKEGQVFLYIHFKHYTPKEIAQVLGVSEKTVSNLLSKAVVNLKLRIGLSVLLYFLHD